MKKLLLFLVLVCSMHAQVFNFTGTDGPAAVHGRAIFTAGVVGSGSSSNWGLTFHYTASSTDPSLIPGTNLWGLAGISGTVSGFGAFAFSMGGGIGSLSVTANSVSVSGLTAYMTANDCTFTVNSTSWTHGASSPGSPVTTGTFVFSWVHSTGTVTPVTTPATITQTQFSQTYTNNGGGSVLVGLGLFTGTPGSGTFTGTIIDPEWLALGAPWTWNTIMDPSDPYIYAPMVMSTTSAFITGRSVFADGTTYFLGQAYGNASGVGADGYADGTVLTSLPTTGQTPTGTAVNGAYTGGSSNDAGGGAATPSGGTVEVNPANTITPTNVTVSAGGTSGGGGGGASDTGLVNNAAAINAGIAAAANSLNSNIASGTAAITSQILKEQLGVQGAIVAAGLGGGGGSGTDNAGIEARLDTGNTNTGAIKGYLDGSAANTPGGLVTAAETAAGVDVPGAGSSSWGDHPTGTAGASHAGGPSSLSFGSIGGSAITGDWNQSGIFSGMEAMLIGGRPLILVALCLLFAGSAGKMALDLIVGVSNVPGTTTATGIEDLVPGAAQTKVALLGVAFVVVFTGFGAGVMAIIDSYLSSVGGPAISGLLYNMNMSGLGAGLGLIDKYFPVDICVTLAIARCALPFILAPIYGAAAATARLLVA